MLSLQEISDKFDYALNQHVGGVALDEYNKSLYLTSANHQIVSALVNQYEYSEIVRIALRPVTDRGVLTNTDFTTEAVQGVDYDIYRATHPVAVKAILWEKANITIPVKPIDQNDKIFSLDKNPFRKPSKHVIWRESIGQNLSLYSHEAITKYEYTYCMIPTPIVLEDLPSPLTVEGVNTATLPQLNSPEVLKVIELAVDLALRDMHKSLLPKPDDAETN